MRNLYLVRHGHVDFPGGIRRCIGWTDLPLDERGQEQGRELGTYFQSLIQQGAAVFASPLTRARETARLLAGDSLPVGVEEGLKELNMGEWENVPMDQLKKTLESWPDTGESREEGLVRIRKTVKSLLSQTTKDVICVAHGGINSCLLADITGTPLKTSRGLPQPYGGFSRIRIREDGQMVAEEIGVMPQGAPDDRECRRIWNHYSTPEPVRRHCEAVCRQAEAIGERLVNSGRNVDLRIIRSGALLHDVARAEADHPRKGGDILLREGYPKVAEVIRYHHDLECPCFGEFDKTLPALWLEAAVVYLADKMVQGDRAVTLERRFEDSRRRCAEAEDREEALAAHERRYIQAKKIESLIRIETDGGQ